VKRLFFVFSIDQIDYHHSEIDRERKEIDEMPEIETEELRQIYEKKADFTEEELSTITKRIRTDKKKLLGSMMNEELGSNDNVGLIVFLKNQENPTRYTFVTVFFVTKIHAFPLFVN